jgi:DNA-binding protein H-NS
MLEADSNHGLSITHSSDANLDALGLASMSVDELWKLHEAIGTMSAQKIAAETMVLQQHLDRLSPRARVVQRRSRKSSELAETQRRPHTQALPKYRNPEKPSQTWNGRGRRPSWINAKLSSGLQLESLMIK